MSKSAESQSSDIIIKSRDEQKRDKETKKEKELDEIIIDSLIEHMVLEGAEKINEGNNGVIFLVNLNDLDKQTIEQLKNINPELLSPGTKSAERKDVVIKMLKIYTGGQGKREFKFQKKSL